MNASHSTRSWFRIFAVLLLSFCITSACASAEEEDAQTGNTATQTTPTEDVLEDTDADEDTTSSTSTPDVEEDPTEPDVGEPDVTEDVAQEVEEEPVDPCPVCCAEDTRCVEGVAAVETCNEDGTAWIQEVCSGNQFCEEGACVDPPQICEPGNTFCLDIETRRTCNAQGTDFIDQPCSGGLCRDGSCRTGAQTGESCESGDDCVGQRCLCKDGVCPEPLGAVWSQGYCTLSGCLETGCPGDEVCADMGVSGSLSGGQYCVAGCLGCSAPGYTCRDLPTRNEEGEVRWDPACFPTDYPKDMGQFCDAHDECLGGLCWKGGRYPENGYCSMPCNADTQCPSNASCVNIDGAGHCILNCGDGTPGSGSCPDELGTEVRCDFKQDVETNENRYVCSPSRL